MIDDSFKYNLYNNGVKEKRIGNNNDVYNLLRDRYLNLQASFYAHFLHFMELNAQAINVIGKDIRMMGNLKINNIM